MPQKRDDELLACLLALAGRHGRVTSAAALTAGLPLVEGRLTPALLERAAARAGMASRIVRSDLTAIDEALLPAIVLNHDGGAYVLHSLDPDAGTATIATADLPEASVTQPLEKLNESFSGSLVLCRPRFRFDQRVSEPSGGAAGHWFWSAVRTNAPVYRDVLLAAFFINVFALVVPLFTMNVYDRVVPNFAVETLWMLAAGVGLALIFDALLRTFRSYFIDLASRRIDVDLSAKIMATVLGMRLEHRPRAVGSFAANLRSFESVRDFMTSASVNTLIDIPFALLLAAVIAWIAPLVLVPILIGILVVVLYGLAIRGRLRDLAETLYRSSSLRNAGLIETLSGLETVKGLGAESRMQRNWEETTAFLASVSIKLRLLGNSAINLTHFVQQAVVVLVIATGVYLIADRALSMGGLIACSMLAGRILAPFGQLSSLITQYHNAVVAMQSLERVMEIPQERPSDRQFLPLNAVQGSIEFRGVGFAYPGSETPSLSDVSFTIQTGERVAILGRVGSGKSTLLKLVMGLYQPSAGAVLIDGIDLRQLDPAVLRESAAYLPQDTTLFYGSLRENVAIAHPGVDDALILRALDIAGVGDFVRRHPRGMDLQVGERGENLSGGQRKSVALARTLVHEPAVVLLDEPTGSMDHSTELAVRTALDEATRGCTTLVVTHRTALLKMVDRVLVIDGGRVVADGPRDEVVEALQQGRIGRVS